jgi:integrase
LLAAAESSDAELCAFLRLVLYRGLRLSEALGLKCGAIALQEARAIVGKTKSGDPRTVLYLAGGMSAFENRASAAERPAWAQSGPPSAIRGRTIMEPGESGTR